MNWTKERTAYLISKFMDGSLTTEETQELHAYIAASPSHATYFSEITQTSPEALIEEYNEAPKKEIWQKITSIVPEASVVPFYQQKWVRNVAAVAAGIGVCTWIFFQTSRPSSSQQEQLAATPLNDVAPGGNKAVLRLANGKTIVLENAGKGLLAEEGNTQIAKLDNNKLSYQTASTTKKEAALTYNTISIPRGGEYVLILPDGSKAFLNAASSLRFPVSFSAAQRVVELRGEAYFEIAPKYFAGTKNKIPFIVDIQSTDGVSSGKVEVLGTHFNIMAYDKNDIRTTLTEGSVKISNASGSQSVLKPGQQAQFRSAAEKNPIIVQDNIDADEVLAWKNGKFSFNNVDIQTIMEQVSRWYDVDFEFEKGVDKNAHFTFEVERDLPLSKLLKAIELTGSHIRFNIEGKKITIIR